MISARLQHFGHFCVCTVKNFLHNRCAVRASALAYTTLLALIPLLAVVVSVTTSLLKKEGEKPIAEFIDKMVGSIAPELNLEVKAGDGADADKRKQVVATITSFIANTQSGTLGATGMIGLVFVAIMLLSNIETTFNDIWGVTRGRSWMARVVQYWAAITLGPLVLVLAIGLTTGPHLKSTQSLIATLPISGQALFSMLFNFLPFVLLSLAFALFYQVMPNTKVLFRAALVGGIVGGCLWQLNSMISVLYVSRAVTYSKIYGSFGMLPLFLVGLYFSWMILLFGAQVAHAFQHRREFWEERQAGDVSQSDREFVALRLMAHVGRVFQDGGKPRTSGQIADALGVPSKLTASIARPLAARGLLVEITNSETAYAPARPLEAISCRDILHALRDGSGAALATNDDSLRETVRACFGKIQQAEAATSSALTVADLVRRPPAGST